MGKTQLQSHERIRRKILDGIEAGQYPPGSQIPSIREMARASGVSTLTVARAIRELSDEGFLRPEHGRGCFVRSPRSGNATGRGTAVILSSVTPERALQVSLFSNTLFPAQQVLMAAGFDVLIHRHVPGSDPEEPIAPLGTAVHSMLVMGIYDLRVLQELTRNVPRAVVLDMDASPAGLDCVFLDDYATMGILVRDMVNRGARRIAYVGGPLPTRDPAMRQYFDPAALVRYDGYRAAFASLDLPAEEQIACFVQGSRGSEPMSEAVRECMRRTPPPDAIIAEGARTALEVTEETSNGQMRPLIAGWGDIDEGERLPERLVALAVPAYTAMGRAGADLLVNGKNPTDEVQRIAVPCRIVR